MNKKIIASALVSLLVGATPAMAGIAYCNDGSILMYDSYWSRDGNRTDYTFYNNSFGVGSDKYVELTKNGAMWKNTVIPVGQQRQLSISNEYAHSIRCSAWR